MNLGRLRNGCMWLERGSGKSYSLALQALDNLHLKTIVVTSPSFRVSKIVAGYLKQICKEHCVDFTEISDAEGIIIVVDKCTVIFKPIVNYVVESTNGDLLLVDEFQSVPQEFWPRIVSHPNWKAVASI